MKDDNILLEALKEIRDCMVNKDRWTPRNALYTIAENAITKYNQSPSDESNQPDAIAELNKFGEFKITLLDHEK